MNALKKIIYSLLIFSLVPIMVTHGGRVLSMRTVQHYLEGGVSLAMVGC